MPKTARRQRTAGEWVSLGLTIAALAAVIALMVFAGRSVLHYFRHPDELRALMHSWGPWAPLGIIAFQIAQIVVAPLPGDVLSFASGYVLGFWPTIVWLVTGVLCGASVNFLLIKLLGRRLLRFFLPAEQLARLDALVLRKGTAYIFLLLLVPNPVGDWIYYLAGLTSIPYPLFIALVFVGKLPSNLLNCSLGATATHFGWREWVVLGLVAAALWLVYYQFRDRIGAFLERVAARHAKRTAAGK